MTREIKTIYQYIYGNWYTMITYVYAELAIADHLHRSPKTVQELARLTGTVSEALHRVLRCATALGFHEHDPHTGRLTLTPLGRLLTSRGEVSMRAAARLNGADYRYGPFVPADVIFHIHEYTQCTHHGIVSNEKGLLV